MNKKNKMEIPFGAYNSELCDFEYAIPEGYEAEIKDGKVIIRKVESEDEKIRKMVLKAFKIFAEKQAYIGHCLDDIDWDKCIDWLAKQGEKKDLEITVDNSTKSVKFPFKAKVIKTGKIISIENGQLSADGKYWIKFSSNREDGFEVYNPEELVQWNCEQKPVPIFRIDDTIIAKDGTYIEKEPFHIDRIEDGCYWDGENTILVCNQDDFEILQTPLFRIGDAIRNKKTGDEVRINRVDLKEHLYNYHGWDGAATIYSDFKFSKQYEWELIEQKSVEWSEEDEKMLSDIIVFVSGYAMKEVNKEWVNFLKSFSQKNSNVERNGKNWKPTEEQIRALNLLLLKGEITEKGQAPCLQSLYNDLKAL